MLAAARPFAGREPVLTQEGAGRVLVQDVVARVDVPPLDNAQMDGYAVRCSDIATVPALLPVALRFAAGDAPGVLPAGAAARIFTGAPIPEGCDAVLMQEITRAQEQGVQILEAPRVGQWIRRRGDDYSEGSVVLAAGQGLRPQHLGIAAAVGVDRLWVVPRPRVALFCTGDELALPGTAPRPGCIYNSNRFVLGGLLQSLGCEVLDMGIVPDSQTATIAALERAAADAQVVISSGGVSVGEEDHVRAALESLGELQLWRIAMKPGKPLAFGRIGLAPFIGLPGNPVSSFVTFVTLVRPFLLRCLGVRDLAPLGLAMPADFERPADPIRCEFLRVRCNSAGRLEPFANQNSALLRSLAWADGLAQISAGETVTRGQAVRYLPLAELTGPP